MEALSYISDYKEINVKPVKRTILDKMKDGSFEHINLNPVPAVTQPAPAKRGRKKKETTATKNEALPDNLVKPSDIVFGESEDISGDNKDLPMYQSNVSYKTEYEESDTLLRTTIAQIDDLSMDIKQDIIGIKESKTMRNKYTYLNNLYSAYASTLSTKIAAIREMNSTTTKSVELDLKRAKELHLNDPVDDDKAVMDLYKNIISLPQENPIAQYAMPINPSTAQFGGYNIDTNTENAIYNSYLNNITPEQKLMRYEEDPDVQTVVIYNKDTYEKRFAVMNVRTGEEITGVPVRDTEMFMPDTTIDEANGIARNTNLNETYKLIVVGNGNIESYY